MKMQMEAIVFQTMIKVENLWVLVKLLRECDAGIKMGIESIKQIIDYVKDCKLKEILHKSSDKHESL